MLMDIGLLILRLVVGLQGPRRPEAIGLIRLPETRRRGAILSEPRASPSPRLGGHRGLGRIRQRCTDRSWIPWPRRSGPDYQRDAGGDRKRALEQGLLEHSRRQ